MANHPQVSQEWLSLTALGRAYGISAVQCGKLLRSAGLRSTDGLPSPRALRKGLARQGCNLRSSSGIEWERQGCGRALEQQGVESISEYRLIKQWADLLEALEQGENAVRTSPEEMAMDLPDHLVAAVNRALEKRGSCIRIGRREWP